MLIISAVYSGHYTWIQSAIDNPIAGHPELKHDAEAKAVRHSANDRTIILRAGHIAAWESLDMPGLEAKRHNPVAA